MNRTSLARRAGAVGLIAVLGFAPPLLARVLPGVLTPVQARVLATGVCYAAAGLALNMVMGYAGQISLGHFTLVGVGAFTAGVITSPAHLALPYILAVPVAAVVGAGVAFLIGLPALRLRGLYLAIATVGFAYAMERSVFRARSLTGGSSGVEIPRPIAGTFTFIRTADLLGVLAVLLALIWIVDTNVTSSRLGRAFQAIRASEPVASAFGIDVARHKLLAFVISGAFAGVAGAMYGPLVGTVNAGLFSYDASLLLVVIVVIGGLGSRGGIVVAAIFYAELPRLLIGVLGDGMRGWDLVIGAAGLMVAVRNHPGGLAEALRERRDKRAMGAASATATADAIAEEDQGTPPIPDLSVLPLPPAIARPEGDEPILQVREVTVRYGGLTAVDAASMDVRAGEIAGLIGPNGAGKTTMFNVVSGLTKPNAGHVRLFGRDVTDLPAHSRAAAGMGRTFQNIGLAKDLSVEENVLLAQHRMARYSIPEALLAAGRRPRVERQLREHARLVLAALGMEDRAGVPVRLLSHGQQRIVELGCVLATGPEVVLLDEPSAGMAPGAVELLAVRLRAIRDDLDRTVVLIEHNVPLVLDVCDTLTVMASGAVIATGSVDEVISHADVVNAYLGEAVPV